jgi:hypothetical protein
MSSWIFCTRTTPFLPPSSMYCAELLMLQEVTAVPFSSIAAGSAAGKLNGTALSHVYSHSCTIQNTPTYYSPCLEVHGVLQQLQFIDMPFTAILPLWWA